MGSNISSLSTQGVANQVKSLGVAYSKFEQPILDFDYNGSVLSKAATSNEDAINDCLDDIGVTSKGQRIRIVEHFNNLFPRVKSGGGGGGVGGGGGGGGGGAPS